MENAIKALLIAAAVLVVILIISIGVETYNIASKQVDAESDLSELEIRVYNEQFAQYEGKNVSGKRVNNMVKKIYKHNLKQTSVYTTVTVKDIGENRLIIDLSADGDPIELPNSKRYNISAEYSSNTRLINCMNIWEVGSNP